MLVKVILAVCSLIIAPSCGGNAAPAADNTPIDAADAAEDSVGDTGATIEDDTATVVPDAPPTGEPCSGKEPLKGDVSWTLDSGGRMRTVRVHLPPSYDSTKPTPVVLNFHGLSSTAAQQEALSHMHAKSNSAGFIAVHAEGVANSWNGGVCCGDAASSKIDDVAHVARVLDELEAKLCVDKRRVFSTGMSNGGALSHRLACELSTRIAAIAPVAHVITVPQATCAPSRPVSVLQFNGTSDSLVPFGGNSTGYPSVASTMDGWATRNGCSTKTTETFKKGDVTCKTYEGCPKGVEVSHCVVDGGGHTWPGGTPVPFLGKTTNDIAATDAMWDFFVKHPR